ncbi:hypothetical protein V1264_013074 [Littorina saxatilis]|uniref:Uncharacterized protein n=1 Tax=Littorina saxatilis TaxID=31220 RepID=A0AAN9BPT4_9CAEN
MQDDVQAKTAGIQQFFQNLLKTSRNDPDRPCRCEEVVLEGDPTLSISTTSPSTLAATPYCRHNKPGKI